MSDSVQLITGVSITVVVPALVEIAKQLGLPSRYAGAAAILIAVALVMIGGFASGAGFDPRQIATWCLAGIVYGLAAAGLYSQTRLR